jgi:hypothetical protein
MIRMFRWVGGACGDTVMKLIVNHDPNILSDFEYTSDVTAAGATPSVKSQKIYAAFPELHGLDHLDSYVDYELAEATFGKLDGKSQRFLFKSHCYQLGMDVLNPYIIDIPTAPDMYPFVSNSLISKNWPDGVRCPVNYVLDTRSQRMAGSYYTMARRQMIAAARYSSQQLQLMDILGGFDQLQSALKRLGFDISDQDFYNTWRGLQDQYMPSQQYQEYVRTKNYCWRDTELSALERYTLLALDKENFKFLNSES